MNKFEFEFEYSDVKADPSSRLKEEEFRQDFLCFCSLMCIIHNKKLNLRMFDIMDPQLLISKVLKMVSIM